MVDIQQGGGGPGASVLSSAERGQVLKLSVNEGSTEDGVAKNSSPLLGFDLEDRCFAISVSL